MTQPPPSLYDYQGVIHVHSVHSDGTGTVAQIAAAAQKSALDFVFLTDHDTLKARQLGEEGHYGPVLVLVGIEISPPAANHLLAFDLEEPVRHGELTGPQLIERVRDKGGFCFLAHPFSQGSRAFRRSGVPWPELDCPGYTGIELWSFATDGGESLRGPIDLLRFIVAPHRYLTGPPPSNVEQWDRLCRSRRVVALGGLDAHQFGLRVGKRVPVRLMAYARTFRQLRTHILSKEPMTGMFEHDRDLLYEALRRGSCYIAYDRLADARGFRFWAEREDRRLKGGMRCALMGERADPGPWVLHAQLPQRANLQLLRNGRSICTSDVATSLAFEAPEPGAYRLEASLHCYGRDRTWILSNPIYLRR